MTMIDTRNSRFPKAVAIEAAAGQWLKCRAADGRKAYGVPSQRTSGRYYLTTQSGCTATVGAPLDKARRDLSDATEAMQAYTARSLSNFNNDRTGDLRDDMEDLRCAVEALARAVASVVLAVECVSNETAGLLNRDATIAKAQARQS